MDAPLNVLILEDRPADAELMVEELRKAGFAPDWRRVDTESEYLAALDANLDVILSDHTLPQFNSVRALERLQELGFDVPFIIVSGTIGEELAVALMKQGAADYVLKDRLARLGQAVLQAVQQKHLRQERQRIEEALSDRETWYRALIEKIYDGILLVDREGKILYASPATIRILGHAPDQLLGRSALELVHPDYLPELLRIFQELARTPGVSASATFRGLTADGTWPWLELTGVNRLDEAPTNAIVLTYRDVSERKRAEAEILAEKNRAQSYLDVAAVMLLALDLDTRVTLINKKGCEIL
ncbi:MAG: PAS domain S-box protein, partial [Thermomicrobiales bacterium]